MVLVVLLGGTLLVAAHNAVLGRDTGHRFDRLLAIWCGMLANSVFIDTLHWRHFSCSPG